MNQRKEWDGKLIYIDYCEGEVSLKKAPSRGEGEKIILLLLKL